ncbi:MAG: hypothetical protein AAF789_12275 [Bacteroidota bacterium]
MKKVIKSIVALLVIVISHSAQSKGLFEVNKLKDGSLLIEIAQMDGAGVAYLVDDQDRVKKKSRIKKNTASTFEINQADLQEGSYTFMLRNKRMQQSVPVIVEDGAITVAWEKQHKLFFPDVATRNKLVEVKLISSEDNGLEISIMAFDGQVLHEDKIQGKVGLIGKRYKFGPGQYQISVSSAEYSRTSYLNFE